ncbi:metal ABC transporter substrate-binding protein [Paenibacillus chondroitinus]|uniref:Metal ABC transporter substrate-binding protein n=1 Tax=Paenibacillus chondroitinus TaxID=59842 RepID=A0ABU6D950_9BACL|nr:MULTISPECIES: metal ABC transporter substrate-binding protein [Paenibacillus]MCY9661869.1 metal ABC transporter substrate-binding protein [Paenibacillus anseongense]MEB4793955.1 metal ABC transporter substrate-binding protein [Paenibacillus chondroitinus]
MKNSWMAKSLVFTALSTLILSGCAAQSSGTGKLNVVTTFYPMYEFTKQVAGEHADVIALIPAGSEPHDWEPSAKDMKKVSDADVFVFNGIVEGWAEQALASAGNSKRVVVEASQGIALMEGLPEEEEEHKDEHKDEHKESADGKILDPHVWLSPALAQKEVEAIVAGLTQADPAHKEDYRRNADAFIAKLKALDESFRTGLNNVKQKDFVTQHAAFGYLAKEYGLTQVPIAGLSPEEEPSPAKMAEIIDFAKQNQVKTIFFETLVDPKVAQTISKEINAKTDVLNPLEGLTDDDKKQNLDYLAIMTKNLEALKKALNE